MNKKTEQEEVKERLNSPLGIIFTMILATPLTIATVLLLWDLFNRI